MKKPIETRSMPAERESKDLITIHTSNLFDPKSKKFLSDRSITVDPKTGLIESVYKREKTFPESAYAKDIDLRGKTVLPGFVDAHSHIFLHPTRETPSINQERDESTVERILRASNHARAALLAGYTTYRDLGSEGVSTADVGFRDAINRGIIPGPRMFVAAEAIASSGGYAIRQENNLGNLGTAVPRISDPADGIEGVRAAVRRRIGAGADVIKFYADYRKRNLRFPDGDWPGALPIQFPPSSGIGSVRNKRRPNIPLFTLEEMKTMVDEARISQAPIAAHAQDPKTVIMAAKSGVTTLEHSFEPSDEALQAMAENGTIFVPTLAEMDTSSLPRGDHERCLEHTHKAYKMGIKVAAGGDTGSGVGHGDNVREVELLYEAGLPLEEALTAATLHGWDACGGDLCGRRFGWFEEGVAADVIALDGDLTKDLKALRKVNFVMKDAKIWKKDGIAVGML